MKKHLTLSLVLAITFTACEEKKKQDGTTTTTTEPAAAEETQEEVAAKREAYIKSNGGTFTDSRNKKTYKTIKIGEQVWMAENLNYETEEGSDCYGNKPDNCRKYGRLYDWETAMKACPDGWHLPSSAEWQTLVDLVGGEKIAGKKLKAISVNGTDNFGFSALLGGAMEINIGYNIDSVGTDGKWWSSSKVGNFFITRIIFYDSDVNIDGNSDKISEAISVRCIQGEAKQAKAEAATFTVCDKGGGVKLLESSTDEGRRVRKYEYDKQNRIVKISYYDNGEISSTTTITYGTEGSVTVKDTYRGGGEGVTKYVKTGNTITTEKNIDTLTIDKDGYIVKGKDYWSYTYEYKDGNLIGIKGRSLDDDRTNGNDYSYDNKKSPFSNSNTPKWLFKDLLENKFASKNNVLGDSWEGEVSGGCDHEYQYDGDGFPVTDTTKCETEGEESTFIKRYTYLCGTKN